MIEKLLVMGLMRVLLLVHVKLGAHILLALGETQGTGCGGVCEVASH